MCGCWLDFFGVGNNWTNNWKCISLKAYRNLVSMGRRALPDKVYPKGHTVIHSLQDGGLRPTRYICIIKLDCIKMIELVILT